MNVATVILNYNDYEDTQKCVDQLLYLKTNTKIIIVDNCSTNNSLQILTEYYDNKNIDVISSGTNGGYAKGNNYGCKYAINNYKSDAILILNPDVILPYKEFVENLYKKLFIDDSIAAISGICIQGTYFNMAHSGWYIPTAKDILLGRCDSLPTKHRLEKPMISYMINPEGLIGIDCLMGCCYMIKTSVLSKVGFLDENTFLYNEETILGIKIKKEGYKEAISIRDFYYHNHNANPLSGFAKRRRVENLYYQSTGYLLTEYYGKKYKAIHRLIHYSNIVRAFIVALLKDSMK